MDRITSPRDINRNLVLLGLASAAAGGNRLFTDGWYRWICSMLGDDWSYAPFLTSPCLMLAGIFSVRIIFILKTANERDVHLNPYCVLAAVLLSIPSALCLAYNHIFGPMQVVGLIELGGLFGLPMVAAGLYAGLLSHSRDINLAPDFDSDAKGERASEEKGTL